MVKSLREHASTEIQPEIAVWAKEYTPRIEDIQTTVTVTKFGKDKTMTQQVDEGYKALFKESLENNSDTTLFRSFALKTSVSGEKGQRILVKGREGVGKSILCQQIVWDWAKGRFLSFAIVFYVSAKVVNPGDVIENVIINQNVKLSITPEKLRFILERVGHKCLIILDGFRDATITNDSDLMQILRRQRLSQCSVLLTLDAGSDLPSGYFETECEVQGFGFNPQKQLSKIIHSQSDVEVIMKWNPSVSIPGTPSMQTNPMLAMFLCVLVNNKMANLENTSLTLNEILSQLIGFLCRKYTSCGLIGVIKSVGKLAFESLQFGRKLSKDDKDVASLDQGILDSGLLICHKSSVVFPQRILQLHLAVLYFIQMLNDGEEIDTLLGPDHENPVFMGNTLFLHFGLDLLSDQTYLPFENRDTIYHKFRTLFLKRINYVQLDLKDFSSVYPSLLSLVFRYKDRNALRFLKEVLSMCTETRTLHLSPEFDVGEILPSMKSVFGNLTSIYLGDSSDPIFTDVLKEANPNEFNVFIQSEAGFQELLDFLNASGRQYSMYCIGNQDSKPVIDLGKIAKPNVKKLFIHQIAKYCMVTGNDMECCTNLTHFSIFGQLSDPEHTMQVLGEANGTGKFPILTHLRFAMTGIAQNQVRGKLLSLFCNPWKTLTHLDLGKTILVSDDFQCLSSLWKLTSLVLRAPDTLMFMPSDFNCVPWYSVAKLHIIEPNKFFPVSERICDVTDLALSTVYSQSFNIVKLLELLDEMSNHVKLLELLDEKGNRARKSVNALTICSGQNSESNWNLTKFKIIHKVQSLDVSNCSYRSSLCRLLCRKFPVLNSLILSNCCLKRPDLLCLAQANVEGWLPMLRHLDISNNTDFGNLRDLFAFGSEWQTIENLRTEINEDADRHKDLQFESLAQKVASGSMSCLKKLSFSTQKADYLPNHSGACWKQLECLEISLCSLSCAEVLAPVAEQIEKERQSCHSGRQQMFPKLHTVTVSFQRSFQGVAPAEKQKLRKHGINVFVVSRCYEEFIHFW